MGFCRCSGSQRHVLSDRYAIKAIPKPRIRQLWSSEWLRMAMRRTDEQLDWLAAQVPDAAVSAKGGRRGTTFGVTTLAGVNRVRVQVAIAMKPLRCCRVGAGSVLTARRGACCVARHIGGRLRALRGPLAAFERRTDREPPHAVGGTDASRGRRHPP